MLIYHWNSLSLLMLLGQPFQYGHQNFVLPRRPNIRLTPKFAQVALAIQFWCDNCSNPSLRCLFRVVQVTSLCAFHFPVLYFVMYRCHKVERELAGNIVALFSISVLVNIGSVTISPSFLFLCFPPFICRVKVLKRECWKIQRVYPWERESEKD